MRIAYIAPYQGPELLRTRPVVRNLALAGNLKIELIAELLRRKDHRVDVLSQGEVVVPPPKYYAGFQETKSFHPDVPVVYASALPLKFINGAWSSNRLLSLFKRRHRAEPYDAVIIYNLKHPQVVCADHAIRRLGLPVVFEYEDDAFVSRQGKAERGARASYYLNAAKSVIDRASACIGVSPHLLSRVPASIPKMLLRGVVNQDILMAGERPITSRKRWVAFSGTHFRDKGLEPLIAGWKLAKLPGWELHIAGRGELTPQLEKMAEGHKTIVFHGLLGRAENAKLLGEAVVGINPHDVSETPGNVFAFKIIEYLAAGAHCITTPMGELEPALEAGVTYMPDNKPETIARTLQQVTEGRFYERIATPAAQATYGPEAVAEGLDDLLRQMQ